ALHQQRRKEALSPVLAPRILEDVDGPSVGRYQTMVRSRASAFVLAVHGGRAADQSREDGIGYPVDEHLSTRQSFGREMTEEIHAFDARRLGKPPRGDDVVADAQGTRLHRLDLTRLGVVRE